MEALPRTFAMHLATDEQPAYHLRSAVHRFRDVGHDDGKPKGRILIAAS